MVDDSKVRIEQDVLGSRRTSNYLVAWMVSIGGIGFSLASLSSFKGQDLLPIGHPSTLIFVPQGLIMGLYGIAAFLLAIYLEIKKAINKLKTREGSLTENSFSPNIDIDIAESQVDNGGLAQKGTP